MAKTVEGATDISRLEAERDEIDQKWRRLRGATVQTPEQPHARDLKIAFIELELQQVNVKLARLNVEATERRLVSVDDVDADVLAQAEAEFEAARAAYDELIHQHQNAYRRRRDAEMDLKLARRTLAEAIHVLEQRRQRRDQMESHPVRGVFPAATWIGDGRR